MKPWGVAKRLPSKKMKRYRSNYSAHLLLFEHKKIIDLRQSNVSLLRIRCFGVDDLTCNIFVLAHVRVSPRLELNL